MDREIVAIDAHRCNRCGLCVEVCPRSIIELGEESAGIKAPQRCILCGHCKAVCPEDAVIHYTLDPNEFAPVLPKDQIPDPETLLAFFRSRRSIRFFKPEPVAQPLLEKIIQAGRFTPSGGNRQPVHFLVLQTPECINHLRQEIHSFLRQEAEAVLEAQERHRKFGEPLPPRAEVKLGYAPLWLRMGKLFEMGKDLLFYYAPVIFVLYLDPEKASPFGVDAGLAAMQMVLMAESLELGTCFSGFLSTALNSSPQLKSLVRIPAAHQVLVSFMTGHPDIRFQRTVARKPAQVTYL